MTRGRSRKRVALLERLLVAAETGGRWRSVIEILVLQALAQNDRGRGAAGLDPLGRALTLAEPEGYVRTFVAEGAPMADMLGVAASRGITPEYVRRLLDAFGRGDGRSGRSQSLVEPLSERELDVLRLLASDLDGPGIADELVVGLSTVRTHTKSIYAKLGVNSRRAAVRRGEELGLLSRQAATANNPHRTPHRWGCAVPTFPSTLGSSAVADADIGETWTGKEPDGRAPRIARRPP